MSGAPEPSLYEEVLARGGVAPHLRPPRPSAAVVLWRRDARNELEVYWVRRSMRVPFMPGWHAFPGGALVPSDAAVPLVGVPCGLGAGATDQPALVEGEELPPDRVPGLVAGALRELFEEVGVAPFAGRAGVDPATLRTLRERVLADAAAVAPELARLGLAFDASALVWAGRWLTPPFTPMRFDNRFFLLEWPAARRDQPEVLPGELESGEWITPAAALERWRRAEVLAAPPILHLLTVLAEAGPERGLARLADPAEADLGPFRRIELRPGIVLLPLATPTLPPATHTNAYLLGTGDAVLVDPGSPFPGEQERLLAAVAAARERLGRTVRAIWLTHHHPDHVGGVAAARAALGVPVLAHPATAERLAARGLVVDAPLEDGARHELGPGFAARVVHTPGHARGHLAFLTEPHRALVCGDLVSALSTIVIDPPEGNMGDYLASLQRAADLAPDTLLPAHGPALYPGRRFLERLIAHRRDREARVLTAWRDGVRDPEAIVGRAYDEVPRGIEALAARQVRAHLDHLRERGLLVEDLS